MMLSSFIDYHYFYLLHPGNGKLKTLTKSGQEGPGGECGTGAPAASSLDYAAKFDGCSANYMI
jgi:hypothetical protein